MELTKGGDARIEDFPIEGNGFIPEIEEVNRCISSGKKESELWSHKDALELGNMVEKVFSIMKEK